MDETRLAVRSSFLLRILNLSFAAFCLLPLMVLFYVSYNFDNADAVLRKQLTWLSYILSTTLLLLFIGVRNYLAKIVLLTDNLKRALFEKMDKNLARDLAKERGEVADIARSFSEIMSRRENNISELERTKRKRHDVLAKVGKALTASENFNEDELKIISDRSCQIAMSLENVNLSRDMEKAYFATMSALKRAGVYAAEIGEKIFLSEEDNKPLKDAETLPGGMIAARSG